MTKPSLNTKPVRVAVDAMGGDYAPAELVAGAVLAARQSGMEILLVGDEKALKQELAHHDAQRLPIRIVPSEGVVVEGEPPVLALRQKPRASVAVTTGLVKLGQADAAVSMGSTGAAVAAAALSLGLLTGLERPALGGPFLGLAPRTVVLDLGSNVDCRPSQFLSFAVIGCVFARKFLDIAEPRVGLLSVGAEEGKGNRQVKEAYPLLKASGLNFVGNVEGIDLFRNRADVVLCDGFVGNILMKFTEGLGVALSEHLMQRLGQIGDPLQAGAVVKEIRHLMTLPESTGGPLLGVNGVVIIGHGRSKAPSVAGAIALAKKALEVDLVETLRSELELLQQRVSL